MSLINAPLKGDSVEPNPRKHRGWIVGAVIFAVFCIGVLILIVMPSEKPTTSEILADSYDTLISHYKSLTELQQDDFWKNAQGETVTWSGKVDEVRKGEILVETKSGNRFKAYFTNQDDELLKIDKGDDITLRGELFQRANLIHNWGIRNVEIVN
ncbi:hypothetical protein [Gorillibacterium massiliense]|uniref:hypothetical protein n=1 Tax=Gorillibacterium massiliense TaxID=1280390 RepID=UPI000593F3C9|nr:hypothetical protein [Gorillibacterium massiliense]